MNTKANSMKFSLLFALAITVASTHAGAAEQTVEARVDSLSRGWAHVNYEVTGKPEQARQAAQLAAEADSLVAEFPNRAEPLVWDAIITATEAGAKGGLGGLSLAKDARQMLERAEKINPTVLGGSVYTSLGSLYSQVPGFPVGFGDPAKARAYLQKALAVNPTGIDQNYFYADFLYRQGDMAGATAAAKKALAAPARPGREVADRGRRAEITALLAKTDSRSKL
jgi:tetratricopeptide (TPR) repeat protein